MMNKLVCRTDARCPVVLLRLTVTAIAITRFSIYGQTLRVPLGNEKSPIDALIPWLLQEDAQLRGIPFSEVIFDVTGKRLLAFNPRNETGFTSGKTNQRRA